MIQIKNTMISGLESALHRKKISHITVAMSVIAPMYWWDELSEYNVETIVNSYPARRKIGAKPFELDDFSHEWLMVSGTEVLMETVTLLNKLRNAYNNYDDWNNDGFPKPLKKTIWYSMIQLLPSSYNQTRTVLLNYQVLQVIYHARKNHNLNEWRDLCRWIETLPYAKELICDV